MVALRPSETFSQNVSVDGGDVRTAKYLIEATIRIREGQQEITRIGRGPRAA